MFKLIETLSSLKEVIEKAEGTTRVDVIPMMTSINTHPIHNDVLFLYLNMYDDVYVLPLNTYDCINLPAKEVFRILEIPSACVYNLRYLLQTLKRVDVSCRDLEMLYWYEYNQVPQLDVTIPPRSAYGRVMSTFKAIYRAIPTPVLADEIHSFHQKYFGDDAIYDHDIAEYQSCLLSSLNYIERYGLYTEHGMEYTQYHPYTLTGRPSNTFGGINYGALNKDDGSRSRFVSRYGSDGILIQFDYTAFHVKLIASLIGYHLPHNVNIHEYLGKMYFQKNSLTEEEYHKAKAQTFKILYGGIPQEYQAYPFFQRTQNLIDTMWDAFQMDGEIATFVFNRPLYKSNLSDMHKMKLFNYLLQSFETEFNIQKICELRDAGLEGLMLYTYDSFLFDVPSTNMNSFIASVKAILETDGMTVSVSVGNDYGNMVDVSHG